MIASIPQSPRLCLTDAQKPQQPPLSQECIASLEHANQ